jgi:hypothetical protein
MSKMEIMRRCMAVALLFTLSSIVIRTVAETKKPDGVLSNASAFGDLARTPVRHPGIAPSIITGSLLNGGGPVQTAPVVYVVYWGWKSDPYGEQAYLSDFLSTIGGTPWLNTVTQYSNAGNPPVLYAGSWSDPTSIPSQPTDAEIQAEALSAVHHFGLGTSVNIQIVVATPTGHSTSGFGTTFCAYHGAIAAYPNVTYTDLPYITDAGSACGENSVRGPLDGVSIVEGHELAESITDPLLNAWKDAGGNEIADKCAWTDLSTVTTSLGTFAVQPLWSNAANGCVLSSQAPAPEFTSKAKAGCDGSWLVGWDTIPNTTIYKLWDEPSGATSFSLLLSTSANNAEFSVGVSTYLEVQACDGSSCGPKSSELLVAYYKGCP